MYIVSKCFEQVDTRAVEYPNNAYSFVIETVDTSILKIKHC